LTKIKFYLSLAATTKTIIIVTMMTTAHMMHHAKWHFHAHMTTTTHHFIKIIINMLEIGCIKELTHDSLKKMFLVN